MRATLIVDCHVENLDSLSGARSHEGVEIDLRGADGDHEGVALILDRAGKPAELREPPELRSQAILREQEISIESIIQMKKD